MTDPSVFAGKAVAVLAETTMASHLPARAAGRVDPMVALREDLNRGPGPGVRNLSMGRLIGAIRARAAVLGAICAMGCAAALEPRAVAFSYEAPEPPPGARVGSYEDVSAVIAAAFERDLGFPPFTATLRLYPDGRSFESALLAVGYEPALARDTARVMAGVGGHRGVLLNEAMLAQLSWPDRVALLAHELTHTLQYELGGGRRGASDQWLREGFAEWVSMRVLERLRVLKPEDFRRAKLRQLRATSAAKAPRLDDMATFPQLVAQAARNDIAPYAQAFLAVDLLIERHGRPAVIRYFELFATSADRRGNFVAAFGQDLGAFEAALLDHVWPRRRRAGTHPSSSSGVRRDGAVRETPGRLTPTQGEGAVPHAAQR